MMLKRILFVVVVMLASSAVSQAFANPVSDKVVAELRAQGFDDITVARTWLGRLRIVGTSATQERELIIHPLTGEVLREFITLLNPSNTNNISNSGLGSGTNGTGGGEDDDGGNDDDGGDDGGDHDSGEDDSGEDDGDHGGDDD